MFDQALTLSPNNSMIFQNLGGAFASQGACGALAVPPPVMELRGHMYNVELRKDTMLTTARMPMVVVVR